VSDLSQLIQTVGSIGIAAIIFAESGLFFGFFLPGDSLLFTAGLLASRGYFSLPALMAVCFVAAVLGDNVGYRFGKRMGPKIFTREDSLFFHKDHIERARSFYEKHGKKTVVLARFVPFVRTFAPILAGVGVMHYPTFFTYNLIGAALWTIGVPLIGFSLGEAIPDIDRYLLPIIGLIVMISIVPPAWHLYKEKRRKRSTV